MDHDCPVAVNKHKVSKIYPSLSDPLGRVKGQIFKFRSK